MNTAVSHYLWKPFKSVGHTFAFLDRLPVQAVSLVLFLAAATVATSAMLSTGSMLAISTAASVVSLIFYIRAYTTKNSAKTCWNLIMLGHLFGALFLAVAAAASWKHLVMYGAGVVTAFIVGRVCLQYLEAKGESSSLRDYHGSMYAFTKLGHLFFIISLLFMAFPISPSFLAQDIMLTTIPGDQAFQMVLFGLSYLLVGVSVMRLYTKVFFGPHKSSYHEVAYKSS